MKDLKNLSLQELKTLLENAGYHPFYANQIFRWVYKRGVNDFSQMTDLSKSARKYLEGIFYFSKLRVLKHKVSSDGVEKFLWELEDDDGIEGVLIPDNKRITLCLSTQLGCKFGCKFCVSGIEGFKRNLSPSEIVNQYLFTKEYVKPRHITNVVFMGVGEPLDNFDNVIKSIKIIKEPQGIYLGTRRICISTCGIIPGIERLLQEKILVKLSLSLHSVDPYKRSKLMPINKKYPLEEVLALLKKMAWYYKFPITFEYILIKDFNTYSEDAYKLARISKTINAKINLIPYNESPYFLWKKPTDEEINEFKRVLKQEGVFFTFRKARGEDIFAACGQLRGYTKGVKKSI